MRQEAIGSQQVSAAHMLEEESQWQGSKSEMEEIDEESTKNSGKYSPLKKNVCNHRRAMKSMGSLSGE